MSRRDRESLDRHITGNYGEDYFKGEKPWCILRVSKNMPDVVPEQTYEPIADTLEDAQKEVEKLNADFGNEFVYTLEHV